jgi:hypothetical protein
MVAFDPISVASGAAVPAAGSIDLPVLSTDILHVPKLV